MLIFNSTCVISFQLSIGVAVLCLPWLRWAQPNLPRPIRVPLVFPIVYLLATLFVTVVPMYASPVETGYGILMILSSIPVYLLFIAWKRKPIWFQKSMGKSHGHTSSCFRPLSFCVCVHHKPFSGNYVSYDLRFTPNRCYSSRRTYTSTTETDDGCASQSGVKGFFNFAPYLSFPKFIKLSTNTHTHTLTSACPLHQLTNSLTN